MRKSLPETAFISFDSKLSSTGGPLFVAAMFREFIGIVAVDTVCTVIWNDEPEPELDEEP